MPGRVVLGHASGDAFDRHVLARVGEEGDGLATLGPGMLRVGIDDAVQVGEPMVVGPAHHHVADVDDEGIRWDGPFRYEYKSRQMQGYTFNVHSWRCGELSLGAVLCFSPTGQRFDQGVPQ